MGRTGIEFTPEQEKSIGELVGDKWGWHFQTSVEGDTPILWAQEGPNTKPQRYKVMSDGRVIFTDG